LLAYREGHCFIDLQENCLNVSTYISQRQTRE